MDAERDADGELTPAEAKQRLAARTVYATLTGVAVFSVPPLGAAMTGAMPGFDMIATVAIKKLGARRLDHAAATVGMNSSPGLLSSPRTLRYGKRDEPSDERWPTAL